AARQATLTTSALSVGSHSITAQFAGDPNFGSSTSAALTQTVNKAATATTVESAANPAGVGQAVTFTATVSVVAPGAGTPTGTVPFFLGTSPTRRSSDLAARQATLTTSALSVGSHSITAQFAGDPNFGSSTSAAL